jgi:hypothetical protein
MLSAREIVPAVLVEILRRAPASPGKIGCAWALAVGPALQRVTDVRWLEDGGILEVHTDARWGREIARSTPLILERLERTLGERIVRRLRIVSGGTHA